MKKICLESQEDGTKKLFNIFNIMLEESNYNLNQFVKADSLVIPKKTEETFVNNLKEFLNMIPEVIKVIENREQFWNSFYELDDYENIEKFVKWLIKYAEAVIKPYEDAAFLQEMDDDSFIDITQYCFENFVIQDTGEYGQEQNKWDISHIRILRRIMNTFFDAVFVENYSKDNAIATMEKRFGINSTRCELWWNLAQEHNEKLWRILLMKQYSRLEAKIDHLLQQFDNE